MFFWNPREMFTHPEVAVMEPGDFLSPSYLNKYYPEYEYEYIYDADKSEIACYRYREITRAELERMQRLLEDVEETDLKKQLLADLEEFDLLQAVDPHGKYDEDMKKEFDEFYLKNKNDKPIETTPVTTLDDDDILKNFF